MVDADARQPHVAAALTLRNTHPLFRAAIHALSEDKRPAGPHHAQGPRPSVSAHDVAELAAWTLDWVTPFATHEDTERIDLARTRLETLLLDPPGEVPELDREEPARDVSVAAVADYAARTAHTANRNPSYASVPAKAVVTRAVRILEAHARADPVEYLAALDQRILRAEFLHQADGIRPTETLQHVVFRGGTPDLNLCLVALRDRAYGLLRKVDGRGSGSAGVWMTSLPRFPMELLRPRLARQCCTRNTRRLRLSEYDRLLLAEQAGPGAPHDASAF